MIKIHLICSKENTKVSKPELFRYIIVILVMENHYKKKLSFSKHSHTCIVHRLSMYKKQASEPRLAVRVGFIKRTRVDLLDNTVGGFMESSFTYR